MTARAAAMIEPTSARLEGITRLFPAQPSVGLDPPRDLSDPLRGGPCHREYGGRLALRLVDLLLPPRPRGLDDLLLLPFGGVDGGVALTLRLQDDGTLLPLRPHLLLHGREHVLGRGDVLDLVAQDLDPPGLRGPVELTDHRRVDVPALLEGAVELDLPDFAAGCRLRQL